MEPNPDISQVPCEISAQRAETALSPRRFGVSPAPPFAAVDASSDSPRLAGDPHESAGFPSTIQHPPACVSQALDPVAASHNPRFVKIPLPNPKFSRHHFRIQLCFLDPYFKCFVQ